MTRSTNRFLWVTMLIAVLVLSACGQGESPVVVVEGAAETQIAATAFYVAQTATAEARLLPTATPTPTGTPYVRPIDNPDIDPKTVIATVAGHDITVEEFVNRVRYERWSVLETLRRVAELSGISAIDIRNPQNPVTPTVVGYLYTLANAESFAEQILESMINDRIMHQEYVDRQLQPNSALLNNLWLRLLGVETQGGDLPENFDELVDEFMAELAPYTAIREIDLRFLLTVRSEQQTLVQAVGSEAKVSPNSFELRDIFVETEADALEIIDLLNEGADFNGLANERSLDPRVTGNGGDLGFFGRGEMVPEFEQASFDAEPGTIVGPVQTQFGFHVIEVLENEISVRVRRIVVPSLEEADAALERLADGEEFGDLVTELSIGPKAAQGGDLGFLTADMIPVAIADVISEAEVGDILGPVETSEGFNIFELVEHRVEQVHARHILVETEQEARDIIEQLQDGADFARLAATNSIDPSASGSGGELGTVSPDQLPDEVVAVLEASQIGSIIGPVETEGGFHVLELKDIKPNMLSPQQYDDMKALHFQNWLRAAYRAVEINEIWREVFPSDPTPIDVAPYLGEMETAMNEALQALSTPTVPSE